MTNLATIGDRGEPGATAIMSRGRPTTYGELAEQVARLRGGLARLGVEPGDRVALLAANNPWFVVGYLATLGVGAVAVPLNPASPAAELRAELNAVGPRVAMVGASGRDAMAGLGAGATPL